MTRRWWLAILLALTIWAPDIRAQPAAPSPPQPQASRTLRQELDASRAELDQQEAALRRPTLGDRELQDLRGRIDPLAEKLRDTVSDLGPKLEGARARLEQLGPKPKEGAPPEGAEVARDRSEREAVVGDLDEQQRLARAMLLQTEQLTSEISDRRRALFTSRLFERNASPVSIDLWGGIARSFPRDVRALQFLLGDTWDRFAGRASPAFLTILGLTLGVAIALHIARRNLAPKLVRRSAEAATVSRRRRLLAALGVLLIEALPAIIGAVIIYQILGVTEVLPPRLVPVLSAILWGVATIGFLRALLDAVLAPDAGTWRVLESDEASAQRVFSFALGFVGLIALGKVFDALNQAIAAGLPLSIGARAVTVIAAVIVLAEFLRRSAPRPVTQEACLGPYIPAGTLIGGPVRLLGWTLVTLILAAAMGGYVAFASFLIDQIAWTATLAALLYLAISLTDEFVGGSLHGETRIVTALGTNLGLRRRSLEQLGVLGTGLARVVLVIVAIFLALAPWGVESGDLTSSLRAAFFGFRIGEVTISLSTIVLALGVFVAGMTVTRILQRWLEATFLPTTELDAGLRDSIGTASGYLGFFAAAAAAFAYLGLSLERIAIVAGALSVGIGFGLQSIVNNFVSGLILLWERPIRVGDLVVVGDGEGYVRRISVRATEIETFDRSSVIIPNSNLISGVVKNRVRGDRTGRVIVAVSFPRNQDPTRAAELLSECAGRHPAVLKEPPPRVMFRKIADSSLDLELICYVEDVTKQYGVNSDLNFAVLRALTDAGILPPLGPGAMNIGGLEPVQRALEHIAEAVRRDASDGGAAGADGNVTASSRPAEPAPRS